MQENSLKMIVNDYLAHYNNFRIDEMLEFFSDDCQFESVANSGNSYFCNGKRELGDLARQGAKAFSQREQVVSHWVIAPAEGQVVIEIKYEATIAQDLPNGLKSGHKLNLRGVSIFKIQNGKIVSLVDYS
jgi:steroid delta-isomerase-like uncharacterized protein